MAKSPKTKLGFQIDDGFHAVLSIKESKEGELYIFPSFAENYSEVEFGNPNAEDPIINQHYTVHNSPNSTENINVIKQTLATTDNKPKITRIFTRAFKQTDLLCPLYIHRCQDLSIKRYKIKESENNNIVDLGAYLPNKSTVYCMVIVGKKGTTIKEEYIDFNVKSIDFQKYTVTFLWSFGAIPSHSTGHKLHSLTIPEIKSQINEGFNENDIVDYLRFNRQMQHLGFLEFIQNEHKKFAAISKFIKQIGFKKSPEINLDNNDVRNLTLNFAYESFINGESELRKGNSNKALRLFEQSKKVFKDQNEQVAFARVLNSEGNLYQQIGKPLNAINCLEKALEIYKKDKQSYSLARGNLNLALVHRDTSNIDTAMVFANKSIELAEKNGFLTILSDAKLELGVLHKNKSQLKKAIKLISDAVIGYKNDKNKEGEAFCLGNLGLIRLMEGDYKASLNLHKEALALFTAIDNQWGIINETANVGNMNCILGDFKLGLSQLNEALQGHKLNGYQYGVATDLKLIGISNVNYGKPKDGIQYLEEAKKLLIIIGNNLEAELIDELIETIRNSK